MQEKKLIILIPVYDDWESLALLLPRIEDVLSTIKTPAHILLIDDGSPVPAPLDLLGKKWDFFIQIDILRLLRNVGHQRAICIGLCHIADNLPCDRIIVMDGDGEDDPNDIPELLKASDQSTETSIVFAERRRRTESILFRFFYYIYRLLHLILVGLRVRFGNYSVVPFEYARQLVVVAEMWNHYAASIILSRLPYTSVPCSRAPRLTGASKMNFVSLVVHGLSALAVFSDRIGARVLMGSIHLMFLTIIGMASVVIIRFTTELSIPGWAAFAFGVLLLLLGQLATISASICLIVLSQRNNFGFLPVKIYSQFVDHVKTIWRRN
jgi:glycosyltransferase involved in cell wall biosynthesis